MGGSIEIGQVLGISVRVHWSVLILAALLGYNISWQVLPLWVPGRSTSAYITAGFVGALLLLLSLMIHEIAHSMVARRFGITVQETTLWALGGVTEMGTPRSPRATFEIAASGPLASLALGGTALGGAVALRPLHGAWPIWVAVLVWLGAANLVLGLFNLVPVTPLDGGRLLQAVLWSRTGDRDRAERAADRGGRTIGLLIVTLGAILLFRAASQGVWLLLIGFFIAVTAEMERRRAVFGSALREVSVADAMSSPVQTAPNWLTVDQFLQTSAQYSRHSTLPLLDHDGRPSGLVALHSLAAVPIAQRSTVRLGDTALPLAQCAVAAPGEQLTEALDRVPTSSVKVLVLDDGRLVGIITNHDIVRIVQRARWPPLRML
ncbi:site-2 protease family protein [Streptacidiphilus sp. EB129]|uniref:site-2 protease family protein n=1 Tax=Streptacidiphilus sp. EB129 TaxID=3156262 RepID=UPI0035155C3F